MVDYTLTDDMEANAATFNILFGDVNLRLKELEKAGSALKKARDEIVDLGLARINEVVGPALQAVEDISDLSDLFRAASLSSVEIGTGVREFNIEPGDRLKFAAPLYVAIAVNGQLDKWMAGQVQSWNNETGQLMVDVTNIRGEGIFADWVVTPTHIPETGPTINAYTKAEVDAIVAQAKADLLGGSPAAALDTLSELAAALADDASFAATITAQLAGKADANDLGALAALDTVDTAQIDNDAVTTEKIADGAVTADKLAPYAKDVGGVDWNDVRANGTYTADYTTNNPLGSDTRRWIGNVVVYGDSWVTQDLWDFTATLPKFYRRHRYNGIWNNWYLIYDRSMPVKSWVSINGVGTIAVLDSFNVSSITDHGTGKYSATMTAPMASGSYSVTAGGELVTDNAVAVGRRVMPTTTVYGQGFTNISTYMDVARAMLTVHGDLA